LRLELLDGDSQGDEVPMLPDEGGLRIVQGTTYPDLGTFQSDFEPGLPDDPDQENRPQGFRR
jgi:hypothetical protein